MNVFRNLINRITLIETGNVIPFPNQGVKPSNSQILDADPEELRQVISIAKIYEENAKLWKKHRNIINDEISNQALQSLSRWADYFSYKNVGIMLDVLRDNKLL
jgi:hypothetical protein